MLGDQTSISQTSRTNARHTEMTYKSENKQNNLFHDRLLVCAEDSIVHHYQMLGVLLLLHCSDSLRL